MYGLDIEGDDLMVHRSWRWLANKISGLLDRPPLPLPDGRLIPSTRLGLALFPPTTNREE